MNWHDLLTPTLVWFFIGLVLFLLELAIPGLILLFFGFGAWVAALSNVLFHPSVPVQILIFGLASVVSLVLLRRFLQRKFFDTAETLSNSIDDEFLNKLGIAETDIPSGKSGKVSFKGTVWNAISDKDIVKGDQVKITGKESITLRITKV